MKRGPLPTDPYRVYVEMWNYMGSVALEDFSCNEILKMVQHFNKQLSTPNVNDVCEKEFCNEWYEFLVVLGKGKKLSELLHLALANDKKFPILQKILSTVSVPPVSTVCCGRGLSQMNLVKSNFRSLLQQQTLGVLMMIKINGLSLNLILKSCEAAVLKF
jgi:hypothetical protein